jgi:hypothetical protein
MKTYAGISAANRAGDDSAAVFANRPVRTWAGHGSGAACTMCGRRIAEHEIEYEVEMGAPDVGHSLRFHFPCYQRWATDARPELAPR